MKIMQYIFLGLCIFYPVIVSALPITGTIHTVHSNLQTRLVHIYFEGKPQFDGSGCISYWTGNSMDDIDFKSFVLPLLLTAQASKQKVAIGVSGCSNGQFPKIYSVDLNPRQ